MSAVTPKSGSPITEPAIEGVSSGDKRPKPKRVYRFGNTISIVLSQDSIEFATARSRFRTARLIDLSKIYIPKSLDTEEKRRDFQTIEINRYLKDFGGKTTRYILGIGGSETALRNITLPKMSNKELKAAIYWEGSKRIPFGLANAYYGYHSNSSLASDGKHLIETTLMAISKNDIDKKLSLLEPLGIQVTAIYQELEALGYFLPYIDNYDPAKTYALINIKSKSSEISFYRGTRLEFMNIISLGSDTLATNDTQTKYEFFTESLVTEISNSLDFYIGQFSNLSTEQVYIYGDLAYSNELIDNLTDHFGIEFKKFSLDNLSKAHRISDNLVDNVPVSLGAAALALSDYNFINFLPDSESEKLASKLFIKWAAPSFLILICTLFTIWWALKYTNDIYTSQVDAATVQIDRIKNSSAYMLYNQIKNHMAAEKAIVEKLYQEQSFLHLNLKEMTRITPKKIKLDILDVQNLGDRKLMILSGKAISKQSPEIVLAEFIAQMENSVFYENIALKKHVKRLENNRFQIDFTIEMDAII